MESTQTPTLKELREAKGLTQDEVAEKVGVKRNTVSRWELMQNLPHPAFHRAYARALGVSPEVLAGIIYGEATKQL
jgi:transcriptional regulator with XRE-family HTH domain